MNRRDQIIINHESIRRRDVHHYRKREIIHILQGGMGFEEGDRENNELTVWSIDNEDKVKLLKFLLNSNSKNLNFVQRKRKFDAKKRMSFRKIII